MDDRLSALGLIGVALILAAISMFAPWWTASATGDSLDFSQSAKPFDAGGRGGNTMIDPGEAMLAGILVLVALLAILVAAIIAFMEYAGQNVRALSPWLLLVSGILLILAPILAVTTWPEGNDEFWDSVSSGGFTASTGAGFGWYVSLAAAVVSIVAALLGLAKRARPAPDVQYARRL